MNNPLSLSQEKTVDILKTVLSELDEGENANLQLVKETLTLLYFTMSKDCLNSQQPATQQTEIRRRKRKPKSNSAKTELEIQIEPAPTEKKEVT